MKPDELKESLVLAIKLISENVDLYYDPDSSSKMARAIKDISMALGILENLGIIEKSAIAAEGGR